jgi:hypothetical protein
MADRAVLDCGDFAPDQASCDIRLRKRRELMRPLECPVCMIRTAAKMAATMACVSSVIKSPPGPPTRPDLYRIGDREYRDQVHRDYVCWSEKQRNVDRRSICACRFKPSSLGFTVSGVVEALLNSPVSGERPPPRCLEMRQRGCLDQGRCSHAPNGRERGQRLGGRLLARSGCYGKAATTGAGAESGRPCRRRRTRHEQVTCAADGIRLPHN